MTGPGRGFEVRCRWCGREIEHCRGETADWMHVADRRERCSVAGQFAEPETGRQVGERLNGGARRSA